MKTITKKVTTALTITFLLSLQAQATKDHFPRSLLRNKYPYQVMVSVGLPHTNDPFSYFGFTAGAAFRYKYHVFGFSTLNRFDMELFTSSFQSLKTRQFYYGVSWSNSWLNFYPTLGLGITRVNRHGEHIENGSWLSSSYHDIAHVSACFEMAMNCQITGRGNGIGLRAFHNFNGYMDYSGVAVSLVLGYNWRN